MPFFPHLFCSRYYESYYACCYDFCKSLDSFLTLPALHIFLHISEYNDCRIKSDLPEGELDDLRKSARPKPPSDEFCSMCYRTDAADLVFCKGDCGRAFHERELTVCDRSERARKSERAKRGRESR